MTENIINDILDTKVVVSDDSDPKNLKFTWDVVAMYKRKLELQLNFEKPLYVSTAEEPEYLEVRLLDTYMFISEEGLPLVPTDEDDEDDDRELLLRKKIPKQLPSGEADLVAMQTLDSAAQGSQAAVYGNFFLNMAMSASLNELWGMINSQQLFLMIPLCAVSLPINAAGFFSQIRQISAFQFFSTSDWLDEWL